MPLPVGLPASRSQRALPRPVSLGRGLRLPAGRQWKGFEAARCVDPISTLRRSSGRSHIVNMSVQLSGLVGHDRGSNADTTSFARVIRPLCHALPPLTFRPCSLSWVIRGHIRRMTHDHGLPGNATTLPHEIRVSLASPGSGHRRTAQPATRTEQSNHPETRTGAGPAPLIAGTMLSGGEVRSAGMFGERVVLDDVPPDLATPPRPTGPKTQPTPHGGITRSVTRRGRSP